jgi:hypothetical protein
VRLRALTFLSALLLVSVAGALDLKLTDKGLAIGAGKMGGFSLPYPELKTNKGTEKPLEVRVQGDKTSIKYPSGVNLLVSLEKGIMHYDFSGNKGGIQSFSCKSMLIDFKFADGGAWMIGLQEAKSFPTQKPVKPFLYQGNADSFSIKSVTGQTVAFRVPEYSFQQLQDNREWGWKIFAWWFSSPFNKDRSRYDIVVSEDVSDVRKVVLVDRFGQSTRKEFPGKIGSEAELKADVASEKAYYASLKQIDTDPYGGMLGSGGRLGLKETGFFHVEKKDDKWYLVDPAGNAFFHLGICVFGGGDDFTYIEGREEQYEWIPPTTGLYAAARSEDKWWFPRAVSFYRANVIRKYGPFDKSAFTRRMIDRVRAMGFNSVGAFSPGTDTCPEKNFPYVAHLPFGWNFAPDIPGVRGLFDPFDPAIARKVDEKFRSLTQKANNPLIIGYFLANEQGMEDIPRAIPKLPAKHPCKLELVKLLQHKYGSIAAFNTAWDGGAASFDALKDAGIPMTTKAAFADMEAFSEILIDAYYKLVADAFHTYDTNHMLIGNRWQPSTANNEILCRVAGKYMDIISINYYTDAIDNGLMDRINQWTGGKPQFWSEFYFSSEKESNVLGGGHDFDTQADRGRAYRHYIENAAATGYVLGTEWFTLIDQSVTGRFFSKYNGERNNTGIFDVADRPYRDMVAQMSAGHQHLHDVYLNGAKPYQFDHPRFTGKGDTTRMVTAGHALGPMVMDGQLENWPGRPPVRIDPSHLVSGKEASTLEASFKASWDEQNLYLLINVIDPTPMRNKHSGGSYWNADCVELFLGVEQLDRGGALLFTDKQFLLGAGKADGSQHYVPNVPKQPKVSMAVVRDGDKGYTMEVAIPWVDLGVDPKEGTALLFDMAVDNSDEGDRRNAQIMWNGGARNSSDRSLWGRLRLDR